MAANVEAIAFVLDGAGQAADLPGVLFEDGDRDFVFEQLIGRGQAGRTCAHDHDVRSPAFGDQSPHRVATRPEGSVLLVQRSFVAGLVHLDDGIS
jgi:hypothetical protein